ncbi:proteasome assembly chaperone family protein [Phytoactinopolyspora halotolerans]|uniref:PAC2 family protein n=1 Tax=Phytoactinopolyspora halotolerans TaxID=1981512 RepID=A0A6L9SHW6_9ACTN|nr:PAC2 family protein [Phytoactinopolyspora halotolerans]NEE04234.1 PAC2 family protein [Phytoactinopolyspora halotolerans]
MPDTVYELTDDAPELQSPVLLFCLNGFVDAGHAGSGIVDHLIETLDHRELARFDVDRLIDYRSRRPEMHFADGRFVSYSAPELNLYLMHDDVGAPFLLLAGPEPDVMWETFTAAVIELIERFDVRLTAGFHGIPTPTPHTRPIGVSGYSSRRGLIPDDQVLGMELSVPGSAGSLLQYRLAQAGKDAVGLIARVPHYLTESEYPQASLSLLRSLSSVTGLLLPTGSLLEASEQAERLVQEQVAENEQVARVVQALETQYDAFVGGDARGNLIAEPKTMPTAEEIGAEFERFLADLDPPDDESS